LVLLVYPIGITNNVLGWREPEVDACAPGLVLRDISAGLSRPGPPRPCALFHSALSAVAYVPYVALRGGGPPPYDLDLLARRLPGLPGELTVVSRLLNLLAALAIVALCHEAALLLYGEGLQAGYVALATALTGGLAFHATVTFFENSALMWVFACLCCFLRLLKGASPRWGAACGLFAGLALATHERMAGYLALSLPLCCLLAALRGRITAALALLAALALSLVLANNVLFDDHGAEPALSHLVFQVGRVQPEAWGGGLLHKVRHQLGVQGHALRLIFWNSGGVALLLALFHGGRLLRRRGVALAALTFPLGYHLFCVAAVGWTCGRYVLGQALLVPLFAAPLVRRSWVALLCLLPQAAVLIAIKVADTYYHPGRALQAAALQAKRAGLTIAVQGFSAPYQGWCEKRGGCVVLQDGAGPCQADMVIARGAATCTCPQGEERDLRRPPDWLRLLVRKGCYLYSQGPEALEVRRCLRGPPASPAPPPHEEQGAEEQQRSARPLPIPDDVQPQPLAERRGVAEEKLRQRQPQPQEQRPPAGGEERGAAHDQARRQHPQHAPYVRRPQRRQQGAAEEQRGGPQERPAPRPGHDRQAEQGPQPEEAPGVQHLVSQEGETGQAILVDGEARHVPGPDDHPDQQQHRDGCGEKGQHHGRPAPPQPGRDQEQGALAHQQAGQGQHHEGGEAPRKQAVELQGDHQQAGDIGEEGVVVMIEVAGCAVDQDQAAGSRQRTERTAQGQARQVQTEERAGGDQAEGGFRAQPADPRHRARHKGHGHPIAERGGHGAAVTPPRHAQVVQRVPRQVTARRRPARHAPGDQDVPEQHQPQRQGSGLEESGRVHHAPLIAPLRSRRHVGLRQGGAKSEGPPYPFRRGHSPYAKSGKKNTSSVAITRSPRAESSRAPMGATGIGRHGAKYRSSVNSQSSATPSPPSVRLSSSPCVATPPGEHPRDQRAPRPAPSQRPQRRAHHAAGQRRHHRMRRPPVPERRLIRDPQLERHHVRVRQERERRHPRHRHPQRRPPFLYVVIYPDIEPRRREADCNVSQAGHLASIPDNALAVRHRHGEDRPAQSCPAARGPGDRFMAFLPSGPRCVV
jgi:hypothetical protein